MSPRMILMQYEAISELQWISTDEKLHTIRGFLWQSKHGFLKGENFERNEVLSMRESVDRWLLVYLLETGERSEIDIAFSCFHFKEISLVSGLSKISRSIYSALALSQ